MLRGGREALNLGSFDVAETLGREILNLDASNAEARVILGRALYYKKNMAGAIEQFTLGLKPDAQPDVWLEFARAHQSQQQWPQAIAAFRTAFALRPPTALQCAELGHAYNNSLQHTLAAEAFAQATTLEPGNADYWNDLGTAHLDANDLAVARENFRQAAKRQPGHIAALSNFGLVCELMGDSVGVLSAADELVQAHPAHAALLQKRGVARLSQGQLVDGWTDYRARFTNPAHRGWHVGIPKPMWDGAASLADKGVLVWSDQGLGDQLLTAGLLTDALAAAKRVVFSCEPRLATLIQRSFPQVRTVSLFDVPLGGVKLSDTDVQASISELGPAFRPLQSSFPQHGGYLKADPHKLAQLKARNHALPGKGPIIGVSWRSNNEVAASFKTLALANWAQLFAAAPARFVSLQYGDVAGEVAQAKANVFVDPAIDAINDVDGFAAQVAAMDGVITTSNTTVHMAGALNIPTLLLTPLAEGRAWYWFVGQERSAWYPSVRHLWQTQRRRWDDVIDRAAKILSEGFGQGR
jgi:tetratricopeptide (TPR) repeat protein